MKNNRSVSCDKCGSLITPNQSESSSSFIKTARMEGWSIGKKDFCPDCRLRQQAQYTYEMTTSFPSEWNVESARETVKARNKHIAGLIARALCRYRFGDNFEREGISCKVNSRRSKR